MGIDRINGSDKPQESGTPDTQDTPPSLPPDKPGTPGQPSRRESRAAARALQREAAEGRSGPGAKGEQPQEKDDKPAVPAPAEPADDKPRPKAETGPPETEEADRSQRPGEERRTEDSEQDDEDSGPLAEGKDLPADPPDSQAEDLEGEQPEEEASDAITDDDTSAQEEHDEPGSWRGEGGQYLTREQNYQVREQYKDIARNEPKITASLQSIEKDFADVQLVGLEYRLKGEGRFKEKIAEKLADQPLRDPGEIARSTHDAIRYTYEIPTESYAKGYEKISNRLTEQGHEMMLSRNSWDNPTYKGINSRWRTPEGQIFEVQFHTPESFQAKQQTHRAYEAIRNPLTEESERRALQEEQRRISSEVPLPGEFSKFTDPGESH